MNDKSDQDLPKVTRLRSEKVVLIFQQHGFFLFFFFFNPVTKRCWHPLPVLERLIKTRVRGVFHYFFLSLLKGAWVSIVQIIFFFSPLNVITSEGTNI